MELPHDSSVHSSIMGTTRAGVRGAACHGIECNWSTWYQQRKHKHGVPEAITEYLDRWRRSHLHMAVREPAALTLPELGLEQCLRQSRSGVGIIDIRSQKLQECRRGFGGPLPPATSKHLLHHNELAHMQCQLVFKSCGILVQLSLGEHGAPG